MWKKMGEMNKSKVLSYSTGMLLLLVGIGAVVVGMGLVIEPSGDRIGLPLDLLKNSPFEDFLIPGFALFVINGFGSLFGALLVFLKNRFAGFTTMILGIAMIIWITAQVIWIGWESLLQPIFLVGLVELALGFLLTGGTIEHGRIHRHHPHAINKSKPIPKG
jgi:hypothetical protein